MEKFERPLKRKQFFDALVKTEMTYCFSGKTVTVFQLVYLPDKHRYLNFTISETNKQKAWKYFKTIQG